MNSPENGQGPLNVTSVRKVQQSAGFAAGFVVRHPGQSLTAKSNKGKWKINGGKLDENNSYYSQLRIHRAIRIRADTRHARDHRHDNANCGDA
jgi:hypothetical protein